MSLETLALNSYPLNGDDVLRARRQPVGPVGEGRACFGICVVQAKDEHTSVASHSRAATTTRIMKIRISKNTHFQRFSEILNSEILNFRIIVVVAARSAAVRERCGTADSARTRPTTARENFGTAHSVRTRPTTAQMQYEFNFVEGVHTENLVNLGGVPIAGMFGEVCLVQHLSLLFLTRIQVHESRNFGPTLVVGSSDR